MKIIRDNKTSNSAGRYTKLSDGTAIETWYDRRSRNWVTYKLDVSRCQIGDAEYVGTQSGAKLCRVCRSDIVRRNRRDPEREDELRTIIANRARIASNSIKGENT